MTGPAATCELWLGGARVPDAGLDLYAGRPTALSGLSIAWGRDGPNEQPGPSTCDVEILDTALSPTFVDTLHVGVPVQVWATGALDLGGPQPTTYDNGSFVGIPNKAVPAADAEQVNVTASYVSERMSTLFGDHGRLIVPPRKYNLLDTDPPTVWDTIPTATQSDVWTLAVTVTAPAGVQYRVDPIALASPLRDAPKPVFAFTPTPPTRTGTGVAQTHTQTFTVTQLAAPAWLAVSVYMTDPLTGRKWSDQATTWTATPGTWTSFGNYTFTIDNFALYPPQVTHRRVLVFAGAVSDLNVSPSDAGITAKVTAVDLGADLGNRVIGDDPWPEQSVGVRVRRVLELAGYADTVGRVDPPLDATRVAPRDVDAQAAYGLLQDLAQTAGGVLWASTHATRGADVWIENPANRAAVLAFTLDAGLVVITSTALAGAALLTACDLLRDPMTWQQSTADVVTVAAVTWAEASLDGDGQPVSTERTETVVDAAGQALYGTRRLSVSTELTTAAAAATMANQVLAAARAVGWRLDGLTLDTGLIADTTASVSDLDRTTTLLDLLDGTLRAGKALTLVDLPDWTPAGGQVSVYTEGGRYDYTGGAWTLALQVTPSTGQGTSASWEAFTTPGWAWNQFDPTIAWRDAYGVTV